MDLEDMTFKEWQKRCSSLAKRYVDLTDILDDDDPYDLKDAMDEYYEDGATPEEFIQEMFADDLAKRGYDEDLARQAMEDAESDDDDDDEDDEEEDEDF